MWSLQYKKAPNVNKYFVGKLCWDIKKKNQSLLFNDDPQGGIFNSTLTFMKDFNLAHH